MRTLHIVLGDQLDRHIAPLLALNPARDVVLMMEVADESTHVASHIQRTVLFLSAMRHFAADLRDRGLRVDYVALDAPDNTQTFASEIRRAVERHEPTQLGVVRPGSWRVLRALEQAAEGCGLPLKVHADERFLSTTAAFSVWAEGRKRLTMEHFYRRERRRLGVLIEADGKSPVGGTWNFDHDNREPFKARPSPPPPARPTPDAVTLEVIAMVREQLPDLPGELDDEGPNAFRWPVTPVQAQEALERFIDERLPRFGTYEDAMWPGERHLYHSLLAAALNLGLLRPMTCIKAAVAAWERGDAPLNAVEGFVRQIMGWREFIRGIYWHEGASYRERNALAQHGRLPAFFWTGDTPMRCLADSLESALGEAYNHHIPRLMVIGAFTMLAGVHPREVGDWYLGIYADAVDWVSAPNTIGMSQYADGGVVGTKPYAGSARYLGKMGHDCRGCGFDERARTDDKARDGTLGPCPMNVFYWDFLRRHRESFRDNVRMAMMLRNVDRLSSEERDAIERAARRLRAEMGISA